MVKAQPNSVISRDTAPAAHGLSSPHVRVRQPLRDQIDDAMAVLRHQLERLYEGPSIGGALDDRSVIAGLEAELEELKQARANLGPNDR